MLKAKYVQMDLISNNPAFSSILQVGSKIFGVTHFESPRPGVAYVAEYEQNSANGMLTVSALGNAGASMCQHLRLTCGNRLTACAWPQCCRPSASSP